MRTPRESFLASGQVVDFQKVIATKAFEVACDYALLEMADEIRDPINPTGLAQIIGARRVLEILSTLHEPVKPPVQPKRDKLNYGH